MDNLKSPPNDPHTSNSNVNKDGTEKAVIPDRQIPSHASNLGFVVGPDLLSEILNNKRMELLKSQEVKDFLILQQHSKLSDKPVNSDHGEVDRSGNGSHDDKVNSQNIDHASASSSNHGR